RTATLFTYSRSQPLSCLESPTVLPRIQTRRLRRFEYLAFCLSRAPLTDAVHKPNRIAIKMQWAIRSSENIHRVDFLPPRRIGARDRPRIGTRRPGVYHFRH